MKGRSINMTVLFVSDITNRSLRLVVARIIHVLVVSMICC